MPGHAVLRRKHFGQFIFAVVVFMLLVDGEFRRTEALDRWTGVATATAGGITVPFNFIVLVNPGIGASWEWRFQNVQILSGFLDATVSGTKVQGAAFSTGGAAFTPGIPPCKFSGTIIGNRVDGTFDPVSCGGEGTFVLIKQ